jgi:uncharacterized repeat protein (TIGR03803 family)
MPAERWKKLKRSRAVAVIIAFATFCPGVGSAASYKILHSFNGADGTGPWGGVTFDQTGSLLGASASGGAGTGCSSYGCGVVFKLTQQLNGNWAATVLYSFERNRQHGAIPYGGLTIAGGEVYGTTSRGGTYDSGTVFKLVHGATGWVETILYNFGTHKHDGGEPTSGVALDNAGNLYGTARTIAFELTPGTDGWEEAVLHRFVKQGDGGGVFAGVILDASGNLYGTTEGGGIGCVGGGCGTVYEIERTANGWQERILHYFDNNGKDGVNPGWGTLFMDASGSLYGTTSGGGTNLCGANGVAADLEAAQSLSGDIGNCGTVFELTKRPDGRWKETILYNFQKGATGYSPNTGVVMDKAGNLYGTTDYGGDPSCDCGVIYKLAPDAKGKWTYTVLHTFGVGNDGGVPEGNLVMDSKGNLYGGTVLGGTYGGGVVFELTP